MSQKGAYIAKKEAQRHELNARIELVKAKAEKATAESRPQFWYALSRAGSPSNQQILFGTIQRTRLSNIY